MFKITITFVLITLGTLALFGCGPAVSPTPTRVAPIAAVSENISAVTTQAPAQTAALSTPTPAARTTVAVTATVTPTRTLPQLPLLATVEPMELQDFPRPPGDNGLGMHLYASGYHNEKDLDAAIARLKQLHIKWATVIYADENQLELAARKFSEAGIYVVWRKTLLANQRYFAWGRDIDIIKKYNLPPYMQLYNEPEVSVEWDDGEPDRAEFMNNLLVAAKDVYNAGGYPGIQLLDEDWLREFIDQVYARHGEALFKRMFFIPHAYGLNHPPDYQEDPNGVLGFRVFATIFYKRLGFVPPFIVAEGGWKIRSEEDNRFPAIDEKLHRDYTLAVYDWFRTGKLSHGGKLPDYLFAFNMWMLSGKDEAGAWYDSSFGERTLTIDAVEKIPVFTRKFTWDQ